MNSYLVGGAVRDRLLGLDPKERDWVVVGESPESMIANGFTAVGQFFPVFLHPDTKEEYALARLERSTGPGYGDFEFHTAQDVSLEDDLRRRDLTINAIAQNNEGQLIDPYGGQADLERRILRHVSPAFDEDPLRVLRLARFKAQLSPFNFTIAEDTLDRCRTIVTGKEPHFPGRLSGKYLTKGLAGCTQYGQLSFDQDQHLIALFTNVVHRVTHVELLETRDLHQALRLVQRQPVEHGNLLDDLHQLVLDSVHKAPFR